MDTSIEATARRNLPSTDELLAPPLSLGQLTWLRFRRHKMAILGAITLVLLLVGRFLSAKNTPTSMTPACG
jgi:hypothetical protein